MKTISSSTFVTDQLMLECIKVRGWKGRNIDDIRRAAAMLALEHGTTVFYEFNGRWYEAYSKCLIGSMKTELVDGEPEE